MQVRDIATAVSALQPLLKTAKEGLKTAETQTDMLAFYSSDTHGGWQDPNKEKGKKKGEDGGKSSGLSGLFGGRKDSE